MTEYVAIPKVLLRDLREGLARVEEVIATLEELANREGLERIQMAKEEYKKGEYIRVQSSEEIRKQL